MKINEISTASLDKYTKAADTDYAKASAEGDYKKAYKRSSGMMKAAGKKIDNDVKALRRARGVTEEVKVPTEDGIGWQDIRLLAGEGKLTQKTIKQAIEIIRKHRKQQQGAAITENSDVLAGLTDILKIAASRQTPQNPRYFAQQVKDVALQLKDNPATQKWVSYLDGVVRWADVIANGKEQYSSGFADEVHNVLGPATRAYQDALLNKRGVAEGSEDKNAQQRKVERDKQRTAPAQKARNTAQRKGLTQDKDGTYYAKEGVAESLKPGEYHVHTVHFTDGTSTKIQVKSDEITLPEIKKFFANKGKAVVDVDWDWAVRGEPITLD